MTIRVLPQVTINRIAAGEVIERPASALKELVENSIDAGATKLDLIIESGGRNLISVSDNGKGMTRSELELCVERHATSKLPEDDLLDIHSFGFRGEALPSIGSVGRLKITSKSVNSDEAWSLSIEGGEQSETSPASLNSGTKIELRDLFFATPARLKFLKSERAEQSQANDVINRLAMSYPHISFTLRANGKKTIDYPAEQGDFLDSRLKRLSSVIGKDFSANAVEINTQRDDISITGFCGVPTYNKGTSTSQYIYVNNRPVRDKLILGAIRGAYMDFLARDRHGVVVLFIDIPPEKVDVNVHPAKAEVRFRDSNLVRGMIVSSIKNALSSSGHQASTTIAQSALNSFTTPQFTSAQSTISQQSSYRPSFSKTARPSAYSAPKDLGNIGLMEREASSFFAGTPAEFTNDIFEKDNIAPAAPPPTEYESEKDYSKYPLGAARCQLHKTYIVSQNDDSIIITDQHAAHERLVYEKMKNQAAKNTVKTQKLLIPEIVELNEGDVERLSEKQNDLTKLGLIIEPFGNKSVTIREIPAILGDVNAQKLVRDIADDLVEHGETLSLTEAIEHVTETIACHGSVRSGRIMNIAEMNALLREMEETPHSGQCNHGRPTYVELKLNEIEKLFGRK